MKRESQTLSGSRLRVLFCLALAVILAAATALNTTAANTTPVQYDTVVESSYTHTAVLSEGDLYFWGANDQNQLPGFDQAYSAEPVLLVQNVADFAISENRTLIVTKDGRLLGYGWEPGAGNPYPQAGRILSRNAVQVDASDSLAAYISSTGALYIWGQNYCGDGANTSVPQKIIDSNVVKVSLGNGFGLALMKDGSVYSWGSNASCQTGYVGENGDLSYVSSPVKIAENVRDISAGSYHSCLLKNDDTLWTCGDNSFGQTGAGTEYLYNELTQILTGVRSVSAGNQHNLAVTNDGAVYSWGYGYSGQLGNRSTERIPVPTESVLNFVQVFACSDDTFGITADGYLYSFGNNTNFRLGKSDGSDSLVPRRILDSEMNWVYSVYENEEENSSSDVSSDGAGSENSSPAHGAEDPEEGSSAVDPENEPDTETSEPGTETGEPDTETGEPDTETGEPDTETGEPDTETGEPGTETGEPDTETGEPDTETSEPDTETSEPGTETGEPDTETSEPDSSDVTTGDPSTEDQPVTTHSFKPFMNGDGDGIFRPDENVTRAEFLKMLVAALCDEFDPEADYGPSLFDDVPENAWYLSYVNYAKQNGMIDGDGDGNFRPNDSITRAEASKMTANFMGLSVRSAPSAGYTDVVSYHWAVSYINALTQAGVLSGDGNGKFRPNDSITRAEAAKVVDGACGFSPSTAEAQELLSGVSGNPFTDVIPSRWYYVYLLKAAGYLG